MHRDRSALRSIMIVGVDISIVTGIGRASVVRNSWHVLTSVLCRWSASIERTKSNKSHRRVSRLIRRPWLFFGRLAAIAPADIRYRLFLQCRDKLPRFGFSHLEDALVPL